MDRAFSPFEQGGVVSRGVAPVWYRPAPLALGQALAQWRQKPNEVGEDARATAKGRRACSQLFLHLLSLICLDPHHCGQRKRRMVHRATKSQEPRAEGRSPKPKAGGGRGQG